METPSRLTKKSLAATDYLGRSYARTKPFHQVLKEFQAGSGTRYSKEVVDLISESPELQQELELFLLHHRENVCLEVYKRIKQDGRLKKTEAAAHFSKELQLLYFILSFHI